MPRVMSSAMLAAIQSGEIYPGILLTATFVTGPIYVWGGWGSLSWNSQTWQGIGSLGSISVIEEGSNLQARNVSVSLSGFDATLLSDVLSEFKVDLPISIYLGMFGGSPLALLADPIVAWAGTMDQPTIDVNGQTASITINCENEIIQMKNAPARRYTNDDQQQLYPGDRGFEFVYGIIEKIVYFGAKPNNINNR